MDINTMNSITIRCLYVQNFYDKTENGYLNEKMMFNDQNYIMHWSRIRYTILIIMRVKNRIGN